MNLAHLLFLKPILNEVKKVNKSFESNSTDSTMILNDLIRIFWIIGNKIFVPNTNIEDIGNDINSYLNPKPHLGYQFKKSELLKNKNIYMRMKKPLEKVVKMY